MKLESADAAIEHGCGVCQDHAHIFVAAARSLGYPARYVSGYLLMDDANTEEASHAWAEAHVDGLGWVGFDISNGISPDTRYVRVATGLDYAQAAPVTGTRQATIPPPAGPVRGRGRGRRRRGGGGIRPRG